MRHTGALNEKSRGWSSESEWPCSGQANASENTSSPVTISLPWSSLSTRTKTILSSESEVAVSTASAMRERASGLI